MTSEHRAEGRFPSPVCSRHRAEGRFPAPVRSSHSVEGRFPCPCGVRGGYGGVRGAYGGQEVRGGRGTGGRGYGGGGYGGGNFLPTIYVAETCGKYAPGHRTQLRDGDVKGPVCFAPKCGGPKRR